MCLNTLSKRNTTKTIGWKVFDRADGELYPDIMHSRKTPYSIGRWIKDTKRKPIKRRFIFTYATGFHVFLTVKGAMQWRFFPEVVRKVEFRNVVATGEQDGHKVAVAREMKILEAK